MKKYKIFNGYVEIYSDFYDEINFKVLVNLFRLLDLGFDSLLCTVSYDQNIISISVVNEEINIKKNVERYKKHYNVELSDMQIMVNSNQRLKTLLNVVKDFDVRLTFKSINSNLDNIIVINDNEQNYIKWDRKKYQQNEIKLALQQVLKSLE